MEVKDLGGIPEELMPATDNIILVLNPLKANKIDEDPMWSSSSMPSDWLFAEE